MARKRVPPHDVLLVLVDGKEVPVAERVNGEYRQIMPLEEWEPIAEKIAARACRQMTDYFSGRALVAQQQRG